MTNVEEENLRYKKLQELASYQGEDRVLPASEIQKEMDLEPPATVKLMSKMTMLDTFTEGFEGGELIVLSGPTKHGKTTFAQSLTKNFKEQGINSLWFSFEVQTKQLLKKYPQSSGTHMPRRLYDKRLDWLEERIVESKLKYQTKAVFIDHLHYLVDIEKGRNPSIEIGSIIRKLKILCNEHNVVIFLLAHMGKAKFDEMPNEGDIRDSSFIPQEADSTMMIWRERKRNRKTKSVEYTDNTFLTVSNHRRTGVMGKVIALHYSDGYLSESGGVVDSTAYESGPETQVNI